MKKTISIYFLFIILLNFNCNKSFFYSYLDNVEIQYETEEQKKNIKKALNDILTLNTEELKKQRYDDYRGNKNQWDIITLIMRYFVPDEKNKTLGNNFYKEIKKNNVKAKIKKILRSLK